jgi:hypothetical protein
MNAAWHREHVLGRKATLDERIAWHLEHRRVCACRPPPASLAVYLEPVTAPAKGAAAKTSRRAPAAKKTSRRAAPSKRRAKRSAPARKA